jgi:hypothetical protein
MSSSLDAPRGAAADTDALRAETAALLKRLITCDTSNPPGRESQAVAVIEDHLRDTGLECRRIAEDPDRANLLVRLPGAGTGPSLASSVTSMSYRPGARTGASIRSPASSATGRSGGAARST